MMNESLLHYSATELQQRLRSGEVTSVRLVEDFLDKISTHNHEGMRLNASITVLDRPYALETAQRGKARGPLHGIPIIVKDCIITGPELGLTTTVGAHVFAKRNPIASAPVIDQVLASGLIILGKGNLTEFLGLKSNNTPIACSAVGGQTLSAHRRPDLDEKEQSVRAQYGMKLTPRIASTDGVFKLSNIYDNLGVLGRAPDDLALLTDAIVKEEHRNGRASGSFIKILRDLKWSDLGIGVVAPNWGVPHAVEKWSQKDLKEAYEAIPTRLAARGAKVLYPLDVPEGTVLKCGSDSLVTVAYSEFPSMVEEFIQNFEANPNLKSLDDVIRWNEEHPEALPAPYDTQTELIRSRENNMSGSRH